MTKVMAAKGKRVVAVENDAQALHALQALGVETIPADLDAPNWSDGLDSRRFDAVLACDVLEHLRDPLHTLRRLVGRLAPGGTVVACIPNVSHWSMVDRLLQGEWCAFWPR